MLNWCKSEYYFHTAQRLAARGRINEAISSFQEALKLAPGNAGLRLQFGLTLACKRDYVRAEEELRRARELEPNNTVIPMFLGSILLEQGKNQQAVDCCEESLQGDPDNRFCRTLKGLALFKGQDPKLGRELIRQNFKGGPAWLEALVLLNCESICLAQGKNALEMLEPPLESQEQTETVLTVFDSLRRALRQSIDAMFNFLLAPLQWLTDRRRTAEDPFFGALERVQERLSFRDLAGANQAMKSCLLRDQSQLPPGPLFSLCSVLYEMGQFEEIERLLTRSERAAESSELLMKARAQMRL
jgi:tetratricopeptide (TPR) repeat protein